MRVLYNEVEDSRGEIAIAMTPEEWAAVVVDLQELRSQVHYYRSRGNDASIYEYEPKTAEFIETLAAYGVMI